MELKPILIYGNTLWLGDRQDASNLEWLEKKEIRHIVNVGHVYGRPLWLGNDTVINDAIDKSNDTKKPAFIHTELPSMLKSYTEVHAYDNEDYPILEHLEDISHILDISVFGDDVHHVKEGVLINCHMGINRSASLAAAYISRITGIPATTVINSMRKHRPVIQNKGFLRQLLNFNHEDYTNA